MLKGDKMGKFFGLILLLGFSKLLATDYALVVGIDNHGLVGAKNDAKDMVSILKSRGVKKRNIKTLYNKKATKTNIINTFQNIVNNATAKDRVYFFFSGHGTSYYDPSLKAYPNVKKLLKHTGALVPYGAYPYEYNKLIVASEHLAPLFRTLDTHQVETIIMFDACFSGGAYKGGLHQANNHSHYFTITTKVKDYPYKNIVYISGATRSDYSAESSSENRGYFSLDLSNCFRQYSSLDGIRTCMLSSKLPSIVLPKTGDKRLFAKKGIIVEAKKVERMGEGLFELTTNNDSLYLHTQDKETKEFTRNYTPKTPLDLYLKNDEAGYLVFFMLNAKGKLQMVFPTNTRTPFISANSDKYRLTLSVKNSSNPKDFGEEHFIAFLVNKPTAQLLQEIRIKLDGGVIKENDILKKIITIIKENQKGGTQFSVISHKN